MLPVDQRFGTRLMLACDVRDIPSVNRPAAIKELLMPEAVSERAIVEWLTEGKVPSLKIITTLAARLDVNDSWLALGKTTMLRDRKLGDSSIDWITEQKRMFDFDSAEQRNTGLAWVLLHQPREVVEAFCSPEAGHDVHAMRVDIRVNDVELPVKKFEDLISALANAMMNWKFEHMGMHVMEANALAQAQVMFKNMRNNLYDKLSDATRAFDNLGNDLDAVCQMFWNHHTYDSLHSHALFSVTLPPEPEYRYGDHADTSNRDKAIELFCLMVRDAMCAYPNERGRLHLLSRSIFSGLDERETALAESILNKE